MYNFRNKGLSPLDRIAPLSKTGTSKAWHEEKEIVYEEIHTTDGKTYFYNRATGSRRWSLSDEGTVKSATAMNVNPLFLNDDIGTAGAWEFADEMTPDGQHVENSDDNWRDRHPYRKELRFYRRNVIYITVMILGLIGVAAFLMYSYSNQGSRTPGQIVSQAGAYSPPTQATINNTFTCDLDRAAVYSLVSAQRNNTLNFGPATITDVDLGINAVEVRFSGKLVLNLTDSPPLYILVDGYYRPQNPCNQEPRLVLHGEVDCEWHPGGVHWMYLKQVIIDLDIFVLTRYVNNLGFTVIPVFTFPTFTIVANATVGLHSNFQDWFAILDVVAISTPNSTLTTLASELSGLPPSSSLLDQVNVTTSSSQTSIAARLSVASYNDTALDIMRGVKFTVDAQINPNGNLVAPIRDIDPTISGSIVAKIMFPYGKITWQDMYLGLEILVSNIVITTGCIFKTLGLNIHVQNWQINNAAIYGLLDVGIPSSGNIPQYLEFYFNGNYNLDVYTNVGYYDLIGSVTNTYGDVMNPLGLSWVEEVYNATVIFQFKYLNSTIMTTKVELDAYFNIKIDQNEQLSMTGKLYRDVNSWTSWNIILTGLIGNVRNFYTAAGALPISSSINDTGLIFGNVNVQGYSTIQLASFAAPGVKVGLTVTVSVYIQPNASLSNQIESFRAIASNGTQGMLDKVSPGLFTMEVYVNVFNISQSGAFFFMITENNNFPLSFVTPGLSNQKTAVTCTGLVVYASYSVGDSIAVFSFQVGLKLQFDLQPQPVYAVADVSRNATGYLFFHAGIAGVWPAPFGLSSMSLSNVVITINVNPYNQGGSKVDLLLLSATAGVSFGHYQTSFSIMGQYGPGPSDFVLVASTAIVAKTNEDITLLSSAFTLGNNFGTDLMEVQPYNSACALKLSVSNYDGVVPKGVQINFLASLYTGELYNAKQYFQSGYGNLSVALNLPIYDQPNSWNLRINLNDMVINPNFALTSVSMLAQYGINAGQTGLIISAQATLTFAMSSQSGALVVQLSGFKGVDNINLVGQLTNTILNPWGLSWIYLKGMSASLSLTYNNSTPSFQSFSFQALTIIDQMISVSLSASVDSTGKWVASTSSFVASSLGYFLNNRLGNSSCSYFSFLDAGIVVTLGTKLPVPGLIIQVGGYLSQGVLSEVASLVGIGNATFGFSLFTPLFNSTAVSTYPSTVTAYLDNFVLQELTAVFSVKYFNATASFDKSGSGTLLNNVAVNLDASINIPLQNSLNSLELQLSGNWNRGGNLTLYGSVLSNWNYPFGLSWLKLYSMNAIYSSSLSPISGIFNKTLQINALADFSIGSNSIGVSTTVNVDLQTNEWQLVFNVDATTLPSLLSGVTGGFNSSSTPLAGLQALDPTKYPLSTKLQVIIGTLSNGAAKQGLTILGSVSVTSTTLLTAIANSNATIPNNPFMNTNAGNLFFMRLYVPVFSTTPQSFDLLLQSQGTWVITSNLKSTGVYIASSYRPSSGFSILVQFGVSISIPGSLSPLNLIANVSYAQSSQELILSSQLAAPWKAPFALNWLTVNNCITIMMYNTSSKAFSFTSNGIAVVTWGQSMASGSISASYGSLNGQFQLNVVGVSGVTLTEMSAALFQGSSTTAIPIPQGISLSSTNFAVEISVSNYATGKFPCAGVFISFMVDVPNLNSNNQLGQLSGILNPKASTLFDLSARVFIPFLGYNANSYLAIDLVGILPIGQSVVLTNVEFGFTLANGTSNVQVFLNANLNLISQSVNLPTFNISGSYNPLISGFNFVGVLSNTPWVAPFNVASLTINSLNLKLSLGSASDQSIYLLGSASFLFASSTTASFTVSLQSFNQYLDWRLTAGSVTLSNFVNVISTSAGGRGAAMIPPTYMESIQSVASACSFTFSTFSDNSYQKGITVTANVTVTGGPLRTSISAFNISSTSNSLLSSNSNTCQWQLMLYMNTYSSESFPPTSFVLSEIGSRFPILGDLWGRGLYLSVVLQSGSNPIIKFFLAMELDILYPNNTSPLLFSVSAVYQSPILTMSGNILQPWVAPFGFAPLSLQTGSILMTFNGSSLTSLVMTFNASLVCSNFVGSFSASVQRGQSPYSLAIFGSFPVISTTSIPTFASCLSGSSNIDSNYATLQSVSPFSSGSSSTAFSSFSLTLANFQSNNILFGLTLNAQVSLTNIGDLSSFHNFVTLGQASPVLKLGVNFPIPALNSIITPTYYFDAFLNQSLPISIADGIAFNGTSVSAILNKPVNGTAPSAQFNLNTDLLLGFQSVINANVLFNVQATYQSKSLLNFFGNLEGVYINCFGLSWMTFQSGYLNAVFDFSPQTSLNGNNRVVRLQATGTVDLLLAGNIVQLSYNLNYFNSLTWNVLISSIITPNFAGSIMNLAGVTYSPFALDHMTINGYLSFALSSFNIPATKVYKGLSISANLTGTTNQVSEVLDVAGCMSNVSSSSWYFDLNVYIPVFGKQAITNNVDFSLFLKAHTAMGLLGPVTIDNIYLSILVASGQYTLLFDARCTVDVANGQSLIFDVSGSYMKKILQLNGTLSSGSLTSPWHPFNLPWLSVADAEIDIIVDNNHPTPVLQLLKMNLLGKIATGKYIVTEMFDMEYDYFGATSNGWIISISTQLMWSDLLNVALNAGSLPSVLDSITNVNSNITIVISNVDTAQYLHGVTILMDTVISSGSILNSITFSAGNSSNSNPLLLDGYDPTNAVFLCKFYLPVFTSNYNSSLVFSFYFSQTGILDITSWLESTGFLVNVQVNRASNGALVPTIAVYFGVRLWPNGRNAEYIDLSVSSTYQDSIGFTFQGTMLNSWVAPFSLSWLTIYQGSFYLRLVPVYINGVKQWFCPSVSLNGGAALQFGNVKLISTVLLTKQPINIPLIPNAQGMIIITNPTDIANLNSLGLFRVRVDMGIGNNLGSFLSNVMQPSAISDSVCTLTSSYNGALTAVYSTYADSQYQIGFTANATLKVNQLLGLTKSPATFVFLLYLPPNLSQNSAYILLTNVGPVYISNNAKLTTLNIFFDYRKAPSVGFNADVNVTLQVVDLVNNNLQFNLFGYVQHSSIFYLSGGLSGTWINPFGLSWLTVNQCSMSVLIDTNTTQAVQSFNLTLSFGFILSSSTTLQLGATVIAADDFSRYVVDGILYLGSSGCATDFVTAISPGHTPSTVMNDFDCSSSSLIFTFHLDTNSSSYGPAGLYVQAAAIIKQNGGTLTSFVNSNFKTSSPNNFKFIATLYLPVFSHSIYPFSLTLASSGVAVISPQVSFTGLYASFSIASSSSSPSYVIHAVMYLTIPDSSMTFTVLGTGQGANSVWYGTLTGTWNHPFGSSWLVGYGGGINMNITNNKPTAITTTGYMSLTANPKLIAMGYNLTFSDNMVDYSLFGQFLDVNYFTGIFSASTLTSMSSVTSLLSSLGAGASYIDINLYMSSYTNIQQNIRRGLLINFQAKMSSTGTFSRIVSDLTGAPSGGTLFLTSIFVPVFGAGTDGYLPAPLFHFQLSPATIYSNMAHITNIDIYIQVGVDKNNKEFLYDINAAPAVSETALSVYVTIGFNIFLPSSNVINLSLMGSYTGYNKIITLSAIITNPFSPFNLNWLTLQNWQATLMVNMNSKAVQSFSLGGTVSISIGTNYASATLYGIYIPTGNVFYVAIRGVNPIAWGNSIVALAQSLLSNSGGSSVRSFNVGSPSPANNVGFTLDVVISTGVYFDSFYNMNMPIGISVIGKLPVPTGSMQTAMSMFGTSITNQQFMMGIVLPVFPGATGFQIWFSTPGARITNTVYFLGIRFYAVLQPSPSVSLSFGLEGAIQVTPKNNQALTFQVGASVVLPSTTIIIYGSMTGFWQNAFGISGFNIGNLACQIGFMSQLCPIGCISSLGLGGQLQWYVPSRSTLVTFSLYGLIDIGQGNIFFSTSLVSGNPNAAAISSTDLVSFFNQITGKSILTSIMPVINIYSFDFSFATYSGMFGAISFTPGFLISGSISVFGASVSMMVQAGTSPFDFAFSFTLDATVWCNEIKAALNSWLPSFLANFFDICVDRVSLTDFSFDNILHGILPRLSIEVTVFGIVKDLDIQFNIFNILKSIGSFFLSLIKPLLSIDWSDTCLTSTSCQNNYGVAYQCTHNTFPFLCIPSCNPTDGMGLIFNWGCIRCKLDSECHWSGSHGRSCQGVHWYNILWTTGSCG